MAAQVRGRPTPSPEADLAFTVVALERRTPDIAEVWLRPLADPLVYCAGQYVLLEDVGGRVQPRSYSIANAPRADGLISLLVSRVAGGQASAWIHDGLRPGDSATLSGPYGAFTTGAASTAAWIFLAAGSGLAPFRAMVEEVLGADRRTELTLLFSARTEADVLDRDRFVSLQARCPGFEFIRTLTRGAGPPPHGRIPAILPRLYPDLAGHDVFIAGSGGFVDACARTAQTLGVRHERVHTEPFSSEL